MRYIVKETHGVTGTMFAVIDTFTGETIKFIYWKDEAEKLASRLNQGELEK